MADQYYGRSCTPNLGGVLDTYSKDEVNKLLNQKLNKNQVYAAGLNALATNQETQDGVSTTRAVTPAGLQSKLSNSVSLDSSLFIASSKAVRTAYNLADAALPKSGGTVTGQILGSNSTTTPGYSFNTDPDTGILFAGPNSLSLVTGGSSRLTVSSLGVVSIPASLTVGGESIAGSTSTLTLGSKVLELNQAGSDPDGGGITLKGTTDKTFKWINDYTSWTSSENINLASNKVFKIGNVEVLSSTSLGNNILISSSNIPSGTITNDDLAGGISDTKLNTISSQNKVSLSSVNIFGSTDIGRNLLDADLFVVNGNGAGINGKSSVSRIAEYVYGKISGDVTIASNGSSQISTGSIVNADISSFAEIQVSKLGNGAARQVLQTSTSGSEVEWTGSIDLPGTLDVTGVATFNSAVVCLGKGYLALPSGTTGERPSTASAGMVRYNTSLGIFEGFTSSWGAITGAKGGGPDQVFYENDQTVTTNYTISTGKNAMTSGPITVNSGVIVTIPSGSSWVIV